jgi:MoxR-like ATPase
MTPSLSDADRDQLDELVQGHRIFTLLCSGDTYRGWHDKHIAAFESTPDTDQSSWELFGEMSPGDILIAYDRQGDRDYFYGIGRVAGSFDESVPRVAGDLDSDDYQYQIPTDWITVRSNGERLDKTDISSLSNETVSEVRPSRLDEILDAIDQELGGDAPWSRSANDFLSILHEISESDRLREITIAAMSSHIGREDDLLEEILPVVRAYLFETDTTAPTSERRSTAVGIIADEKEGDHQQILTQCLEGGIHPRTVDEINKGELQEQFDSALEQIEDRWGQYKSRATQTTYVVQLGGSYKPETTHPDLAIKASSLTDDSAAYPESGSRLLYVEEGLCRGEATVSETIDNTDSEGEPLFWMIVEDYKEFAPIKIEEIETAIGRDFDEEVGCVELSAEEAGELPLPLNTVGTIGPDREAIEELLSDETNQQALYRNSLAHLVAGKNLLLYGPPGTGKTRAANILTQALGIDTNLVTANAEWSNHRVVGGYEPEEDGWKPTPGFFTETAISCQSSLRRDTRPSWLIIDELNRANLDEAFGEVFTLLDMDYREDVPIDYGGSNVTLSLSFRIIGTMNTYDQAQLFSLGYAFRRRFAFVEVNSLLNTASDPSLSDYTRSADLSTDDQIEFVVDIMHKQVPAFFEQRSESIQTDVAPIFPEFAVSGIAKATLERLLGEDDLRANGFDFTEAMAVFARETTKRDVIDIGQALLIDATKFVVAHALLFPEETGWETVDQAMVAYIIPQFEQFMPALRRAETIEQDSDAVGQLKEVIGIAEELDFNRTAGILQEALETKQVLGT